MLLHATFPTLLELLEQGFLAFDGRGPGHDVKVGGDHQSLDLGLAPDLPTG